MLNRFYYDCFLILLPYWMLAGLLWWQWIYGSGWCKAIQPTGLIGQSGGRLCGSARKTWRTKGSCARDIVDLFHSIFRITTIWFVVSSFIKSFAVRRTAQALHRCSLTGATESQKEWTSWLWSRPSPQKAFLSYLLRWCQLKRSDPWLNSEASAIFTI